jgi:hypothetical protein
MLLLPLLPLLLPVRPPLAGVVQPYEPLDLNPWPPERRSSRSSGPARAALLPLLLPLLPLPAQFPQLPLPLLARFPQLHGLRLHFRPPLRRPSWRRGPAGALLEPGPGAGGGACHAALAWCSEPESAPKTVNHLNQYGNGVSQSFVHEQH